VEAAEFHYQPIDAEDIEAEPIYNIVLSGDFVEEARRCVTNEDGKVVAPNKHGRRRPGTPEWGFYDDRIYAWFGCLLADYSLPKVMDPRDIADDEDTAIMFDDFDADDLSQSTESSHFVGGIPKSWIRGVTRSVGVPR
jgi:hypothetical protein